MLEKCLLKIRLKFRLFEKRIISMHNDNITELYKKLGYIFKDDSLLVHALKHRSYLVQAKEERIESNERLEFLGDSILSFLVVKHLYKKYPLENEGELSKIKSKLVSGQNLFRIAKEINLGDFLILSISEEKTGGRNKLSILEDTFEAIIGAMYLDGGLRCCEKFIKEFILCDIEKTIQKTEVYNYKSELLELVQSRGFSFPVYKMLKQTGPEHSKLFEIAVYVDNKFIAKGKDNSKKRAEQEASSEALKILKSSDD